MTRVVSLEILEWQSAPPGFLYKIYGGQLHVYECPPRIFVQNLSVKNIVSYEGNFAIVSHPFPLEISPQTHLTRCVLNVLIPIPLFPVMS